jgi:hypothetical protein
MLFTVVDRKPEQLSLGRIKAKFEGESLPTYAKKTNCVMAESSVFFEAYRSVLNVDCTPAYKSGSLSHGRLYPLSECFAN